ncbi:MAG: CpaF family protein [Clostridia bacterium]|nr:CpaF family protein [Clostridia bacterium]
MIINAYKVSLKEPVKHQKTNNEIIKELTSTLIKEQDELIENNDKTKMEENITSCLYNTYHLNDTARIGVIKKEIIDKIYGYGILQKYIDNEQISDIRVVSYDLIYIKERGKWKKVGDTFESKQELEEYVRFCALKNNSSINFETPIVVFSDRKDSLRIEAGIEPANVMGPSLVIRIHRKNVVANLEKLYAEYNMLDKQSYKIMKFEIGNMNNVILCGKGGSGKTTLLKALIERIPEEVAITTNEETAELYLKNRNVIQRECILNRTENKNVDLEQLSRHSLVMSNDVIIIGELKGAEANAFFDSISTGHTGLATVHADSVRNTIDRLITLIKKDIKAQYYTEEFLRRFLSSSVDYIIFMKEFKVNEIAKLVLNEETNKIEYKSLYKLKEN